MSDADHDRMPAARSSDRVALVTGGGAGIGRAVAERFAAEGYGIAVLDADGAAAEAVAERLRGDGTRAIAVCASVTDAEAVDGAVARTVADLGGLHVLVNNAGISCNVPTLELGVEAWRRAVDINLTGVFLCARAAGRHMVDQGGGAIINMSSMYGTVAAPERAAYCAAKGGVDMLTRVLAVEWAASGVRVNAIAPGYVETALMKDLIAAGRMDGEALLRRTPLGRFGSPDEVAELAFFLASDRAGFLTGQVVGLDGGWTANGYL